MPDSATQSQSSSGGSSLAQQVVNYAMEYVNRGNPYTYGGSGEPLTDSNVNKLANTWKNNSDAYYEHVKPGGKDYSKVNQSGMECVDCSGLTQKVFSKVGKSIPRTASDQYNCGTDVGWQNAQPGDLVVRSGHASIMGTNGKIIEAKGWKWGCTNDRAPDNRYRAIRLVSGGSSVTGGSTTTSGGSTTTSGGSTTSSGGSTASSGGSFNVSAAVSYNKSRGYSKEEWKMIQGVVGTTVDGDPGKMTATAIYEWQKANNLEADGKCGPMTYAAIKQANSGGSSSSGGSSTTSSGGGSTASSGGETTASSGGQTTTSSSGGSSSSSASSGTVNINVSSAVAYNKGRGYSKDKWKKIQEKVNTTADGDPGPQTAKAIAVWQKNNGLEVDGKCGPNTLKSMKLDEGGSSSSSSGESSSSSSTPKPTTTDSSDLPAGNITAHFTWSEFACHNGDQVPKEYRANCKKLCENLEILRSALGDKSISVTSGYRSPSYNASIDGAKNSMHKYAKAADIKVSGVTPSKVREKIKELGKNKQIYVGGLGKYDSFTHYDVRDNSSSNFVTW